jgi:diguanylate cyclase (GGDEF)-like protein
MTAGDGAREPGRLIYLVDGNAGPAEALTAQLAHLGYAVRRFDSWANAAADLVEPPESLSGPPVLPTAIIVDLGQLDGGDRLKGAGLLEGGEALGPVGRIPVMFVSAIDDLTSRLRAVRAGGVGFFGYPVDVPLLVDGLDALSTDLPREPERILIVDDDRIQANLAAIYLRRAGMSVKVVTDPLTTIDTLGEFQPELVLLDVYMPLCTGMELAAAIRQMEAFVGLPIVFLSAETDRDKQLAAVGQGADDFLVKPIKPEHLISAVVSRTERYRKLRAVMMRDGLTSLFNHSTVTDRLVHEVNRATRQQGCVSAAMLDIDHFKRINDTHGHPVGDRVIKSLARLLTQRLRSTDIIGRYGGEEFLVILPDTTPEAAGRLIDQLRQAFSKLHHRAGSRQFSATFSAGVACFPAVPDAAALKEAADLALYRAKHAGRNRVAVGEALVPSGEPKAADEPRSAVASH